MQKKIFARKCDCCKSGMNSGYVIDDGMEYYCSKKCLHSIYTEEEWNEMTNEDSLFLGASSYYTEWEDEEDYQYIKNGNILTER